MGGGGGVGIVGSEDDVSGEGGEVGQPAQGVDVCALWEFVDLRGGGGERHCRVVESRFWGVGGFA